MFFFTKNMAIDSDLNVRYLETDDLTVLSEKYSRLTKYVGCCVERVRYVTVANLNEQIYL